MGSFKSKGRNHGLNRRRGKSSPGRQGFPRIESLEDRRLLSGSGGGTLTPLWQPTSTNLFDAQNGPMANLGAGLVDVYAAYVQDGNSAAGLQAQFPLDDIENGMVGVQLKMLSGGDFNQFLSQLTEVGMNVTTSSSYYALVDGYAPVNELPTIAELAQTQSGSVITRPIASAGTNYQGVAYNEAETSMFADVARTQFNVDGTGVTVAAISDSVSKVGGGLADSYATGDLSSSNPVDVVQDDPNTGGTDEGRAMLENVHDIAPGSSLAFATGEGGDLNFANNIEALATTAKASIIADDLTYADEPMFQDGLIAQAVDTVTSDGVTYFSDAENDGPNNGYLSTFRASSGSINGIGSGTFMNFNPNGGTNLELPITTSVSNAVLIFQYDQPFETQEPSGSPGAVTSQVDFYVIDANTGNVVFGAAQNSNTIATQQPYQEVVIPSAGSYYVAIQVVSGSNPGHVEFVSFNDTNTAVTVSQTYGSAGGTSYPSSYGHHTAVSNIGVAAVPWWAPSPYLGETPLLSEPYSSSGPGLKDLSIQGTPITPVTVDNPTITAPDGGNTSFFGQIIDTSNPGVGQPPTATNLSQDLPSFFGTSSATPNAAAVAALMKELVPSATPTQIRSSMIASASLHPMNGEAPGAWNPQGGYGFLNAIDALNAIDQLRVVTTTPANGSTATTAPSVIQVTFNKPVVFSTLSAADLVFTSAPAGVTVNVGAPIAVDNPTDPTIVDFPISFTKAVGVLANGTYTFSIQSPTSGTGVVAEDGKTLVGSSPITFTLADTTAPTIVNTAINGRTVSIQFSKAIDPATVNLNDILVLRKGGAAAWPPTAATIFTGGYTDLNSDPRATISYNPLTFTVTLDYSNLPQTELPSDDYAVVVLSPTTPGAAGITDLVGNALDGYFTGSFPTAAYQGQPYDFVQNLGYEALQAPTITTFTMSPSSDTGITGDQNTDQSQPQFIGQIYVPFPGSVSGDQVYVQFSGDNGGTTTLAVGGTTAPGATTGRGYVGSFDVSTTTDASGTFTVTAPPNLVEGFQSAVAVVVGQADQPPLPGLSSSLTDDFRIDKTPPQILSASLTQGGATLPLPNPVPGEPAGTPHISNLSSLSTLSLNVVDMITPTSGPFATPSIALFDAIDPATASNVSNYALVNTSTNTDESQYIASAAFVSTTVPLSSGDYTEYTGVINLTFSPGLPSGTYEFIAHTHELQYPGLADAAGNFLDDTTVPGEGTRDFILNLAIQNTPTYITGMAMESNYTASGSSAIGGPQSYYELPPASGTNTRDNVSAPPTTFVVDLSNPIPYGNYTSDLLLVRSANSPTAAADGDFGNLGEGGLGATGTGFTIVPGTTVTLYNYSVSATGVITSTQVPAGGSGNRLVLQIQPGTTLPADYYRLYMPNQAGSNGAAGTAIYDIYGNQLDGEFLGNPTSQASTEFQPSSPNVTLVQYEDEQSDGTFRQADMSGDGAPGGAFTTGFAVVPYGNVVYARPDFVENPLLANGAGLSNGSMAAPYPVLAPEGDPNSSLASNTSHNPYLGLNNPAFFQPANFNESYDYSGDGKYEQSALYAASQLAYSGPVVVVAEAGLPSRSPVTGLVTQASYSLVAPAGNPSGSGGSASVPFDTTLVFQAGSALKLQGSSLFVQDQGSALQTQGTLAQPVTFTSYNDASVGGATNNNPDTQPHAGDWGGIVFRDYNDSVAAQQVQFPASSAISGGTADAAGILTGLNGGAAISGAQDAMSILNFADISYAGGSVPQGSSTFYSGITLYNARPMITNSNISKSGGMGGTEGAIGADMDSLREDDTARGPLIRNDSVTGNSLNGLYLMAETNGFIEPTNAMTYPSNPTTLGGAAVTALDPTPYSLAYTLDEPIPVIILAQFIVGQELLENTGGETNYVQNRLYIQPGSMLKFDKGSALDVLDSAASLNVGSRSYIDGFDQNPNYSPNSPGFVAESANDPTVLFTSIYDDTATTPFVPAIDVTGETKTPTLTSAMWGGVGIITGADVVINAATFQYGGGAINTQNYTLDSQSVLAFITDQTTFSFSPDWDPTLGTHAYITNNNFYNNFDAAMQIEPNGLLAGDPLTPLESGHPFFRGNVMQGNGIDGMAVVTERVYLDNASTNFNYIGPVENNAAPGTGTVGSVNDSGYVNQTVNAVWDSTDLTYVLRGTVVLGPEDFGFLSGPGGTISPTNGLLTPNTTTFTAEPDPTVTLTIQAALPGTLLADGSTIPSPGQSVIVKLLNDNTPLDAGSLSGVGQGSNVNAGEDDGAGFAVGVDNGVDPTTDPLIDPGVGSEIRILGIPGNQTTGQQRVPVIITSLRDGTVGTTVRGVQMYNILNSWPTETYNPQFNNSANKSLTTPSAGDGGILYIGGNSLTEYDPTNPFDGSLISNADISYMTRIEVQGGGIVDTYNDISGKAGAPTISTADWWDQLAGYESPVNQLNSPMSFTISDSNLDDFSDAAVFVHPNTAAIDVDWTGANGGVGATPAFPTRSGLAGEPVFLYLYNDTISNSGQGVHINSQTGNDTNGDSVFQAVIQNVTFYNDTYAIQDEAPQHSTNPDNSYASVELLAMNDIFDGSSQVAVDLVGTSGGTSVGQAGFSQLQYNLFANNATNVVATTDDGDFGGNQGASYGDPQFVGPIGAQYDASAQNFELGPNSPAIDAGRSEIGPIAGGNAIYPGTNLTLSGGQVVGTRTNPSTLPGAEVPGKSDLFGEFGGFLFNELFFGNYDSRQIVTLPGSGFFTFPDQWQPVLTSSTSGYSGPSSNANTYNYEPYSGVRDILGYIRVPDPSVPGVGYGSNPFIDIGAYQYVNLHPPEVTAVTATESSSTSTTGSTSVPLYTVNGKAGSNTTPLTIDVTFNEPIDPSTLTGQTVQLEEMGIAPGTTQQFISLAGKLSYSSGTDTLVINLGNAGLTLPTDEYRLILFGSGSPVIQNTQGIALDGENISNGDDPNTGTQQALPSGNGYPGGNFYDTFIINTTPSAIVKGSIQMSPNSDTNIVGDNITSSASPTFTGTISEPNPNLVPLAGQTALLDVGIALDINGTIETFFDPSQLPAGYSQYAQYIRPNAGSALTDTNGNFSVTVGVDAANTGLVTLTTPLPDLQSVYNVGPDGLLSPVPGDDGGYYVARVRSVDQSGNQSNPSDPNAQLPFIVDDTAPTVQFTSPSANQVISSLTGGAVQFTITTSENIDLTHFNASSIQVISAGPDGVLGTSDDQTIKVDPNSIQVTQLDKGTGGTGREQISFSTTGTLTNNLYAVTILNTGPDAVRDIAGNVLASPVTQDFALAIPSLATTLFVGGSSYVSSSSATVGTRENPYPTISAAMTAATAGDVVAVLPGVYTESVTLKQFVRLLSAASTSTDTTVFTTSTGDPLSTVIRAPAGSSAIGTVIATDLQSYTGLQTEIAGFTIASPLLGDPALGTINSAASAISVTNSNLLIDKDYVADSGIGIGVTTSGASALTPQIEDDVIVGNIAGVVLDDGGSTSAAAGPVQIINNDFVYNTTGLDMFNTAATPMQAYVASNIFWQDHDQTNARNGFAIYSATPNLITMRNNMFQGDGSSDSTTSDTTATNDLGNGFDPAALNSSLPDELGNFVGNPAFAYPIDPRPGADGPANLFVNSDFDLTAKSAAINNAWEATAIPTDILGNSQVNVAGYGWGLAGYGPRDIGAYEFDGTGGIAIGGAFRVVTSSLVPVGGAPLAGGSTLLLPSSPTTITVKFSGAINPNTINATDLVLSGSADNPAAPVHATSLTWIDSDTVEFNLSGPLSVPGTLDVSISPDMISSTSGQGNLAYSDSVVIQIGTPPGVVNPTPYPSPTPTPTPNPTPSPTTPTPTSTGTPTPTTPVTVLGPVTPVPAAAPVSVAKSKTAKHHHKAAHPVHKAAKHAGKESKHPAAHKAAAHGAAKHVTHGTAKHPATPATVAVKTDAQHPRATTSLVLSLAGLFKKKKAD
jgi:hypothetical protein